MKTRILQGFGFTVGQDFARARANIALEIDASAFPQKGYVFGWIAGDKASALGFLRGNAQGKVRVCVRKDGLIVGLTPKERATRRYHFRGLVSDFDIETCKQGAGPMVLAWRQARAFWRVATDRAVQS